MIKNLTAMADHISNWIKERAEEAGATTLVLGISGGVDSALVAALCARTGMPVIGVRMPCHSSEESLERGLEVINKFGLIDHTVHLENAFDAISKGIQEQFANSHNVPLYTASTSRAATGALRSCLRAPTLDYVGKVYNGIIVGTGNRDEDEVTRYFQKRGDGCVDISPIAKLHKTEVYQLSAFLGVPQSTLDATPTDDLGARKDGVIESDESRLGMAYREVEWGIREAERFGGTRQEHFNQALQTHTTGYSDREVWVLSTLGRMEKASRHKENPSLPVCDVRSILEKTEKSPVRVLDMVE